MSTELVQVVKKSDIQLLDRMIVEIQSGNYDPVKHKATLDLLKIKKGYSKDGVTALRELNAKDGHDIERERLALDREKFEFKKQQAQRKPTVDIESEEGEEYKEYEDENNHVHTSAYWYDISNVKKHLQQYKQSLLGDNPRRMPTAKELDDTGFSDLVRAIVDYHGGFKRIAEIFGYEYQQ